jgi:pimeloyl-ACP methyl ester carboxylesterase
MYLVCLKNRSCMSADEINAYPTLLKLADHGRAFLKIMRGFELTAEKQDLYLTTLRSAPYPKQIIWARDDPALKLTTHGAQARQALPDAPFHELPGKHFFPEDQPRAIAELVADLASAVRD